MSSIINGYMNSIERENDIFERAIQIESNKISLMVEAYYNKLENDYLLAEQKVMMENGTYEDLTYLYMEANEDAKQNKEGIFAAIKRFIQKIIDRIRNLFGGKESYEGEAPAYYKDLSNEGNKIIGWFNNILNKIKSNDWGELAIIIAKPVAASIVGETIKKIGKSGANKIIKYTKSEYDKVKKSFTDFFKRTTDTANEVTEACSKSNNENAVKTGGFIKTALNFVISAFTGFWNDFKGHFNRSDEDDVIRQQPKESQSEKTDDKKSKELNDELRKKGNEFGKQMKSTADKMNKKIEELVSKKEIKDEDSKKFKDEYDKANSEKGLSNYKTSLSTMLSILRNYTDVKEFENDLKTIDFKYKKLESELQDYTFESYYYMMYDYEIITESDNNIFTNDQLVHELVDILNDF